MQNQIEQKQNIYTVKQFSEKEPAFTIGGIRSLIFNEYYNGLATSGAITRVGRRVLINHQKFFSWLESQQKQQA